MNEHPIEGLMTTAMNSIQDMIDVNTIIGEPIETSNNVVVIPISKVAFGFAAGGSEFKGETIDEYSKRDKEEDIQYRLPFGGGSGAGVSINPIAFLVVQPDGVKLLPVNYASTVEKLLDYVPDLFDKANGLLGKMLNDKQTECKKPKNPPNDNIREEKKKLKNEPEEKNIRTKPRRNRNTVTKNNIPEPNTVIEYEYDEIPESDIGNISDYTNYNDEYDD